jgi:hypothetical protein
LLTIRLFLLLLLVAGLVSGGGALLLGDDERRDGEEAQQSEEENGGQLHRGTGTGAIDQQTRCDEQRDQPAASRCARRQTTANEST